MKAANDALKLDLVWFQYQKPIEAFLHSKVRNSADVEDLMQEVWLKAYQNLATVQEVENVKAWLFQMAHRTVIDFYRKRARDERNRQLPAEELWYQSAEPELEQELIQCLSPLIQALPEESAHLLEVVDLHGMNQKELALKQGISYSTLKSRVQRSRMALKGMFESCCDLSFDNRGALVECDAKSVSCQNG